MWQAVKALLDLGANVNLVDMKGQTALHCASNHCYPEVVEVRSRCTSA